MNSVLWEREVQARKCVEGSVCTVHCVIFQGKLFHLLWIWERMLFYLILLSVRKVRLAYGT